MPQITFEYTSNTALGPNWEKLLLDIHRGISEITGIRIENCKTRILEHQRFSIGAGGDNNAFVHVEIALLEGRSEKLKRELGESMLSHLQSLLVPLNPEKDLQITVEIRDMIRNDYFKYPGGTLTRQ